MDEKQKKTIKGYKGITKRFYEISNKKMKPTLSAIPQFKNLNEGLLKPSNQKVSICTP